jgi:hypothetical protein
MWSLSPAILQLVTDDTPREVGQLLLRPVIAFVEADIIAPFRLRVACRRRPAAKTAHPHRHAETFDLFSQVRRPRTFGECSQEPGPCPWTLCRHHLAVDIGPTGVLKIPFPGKDMDELEETCSLRAASHGEMSTEDIGRLMGVTPERVTQIYMIGLAKYKAGVATKLRSLPDLVEGEWR